MHGAGYAWGKLLDIELYEYYLAIMIYCDYTTVHLIVARTCTLYMYMCTYIAGVAMQFLHTCGRSTHLKGGGASWISVYGNT